MNLSTEEIELIEKNVAIINNDKFGMVVTLSIDVVAFILTTFIGIIS